MERTLDGINQVLDGEIARLRQINGHQCPFYIPVDGVSTCCSHCPRTNPVVRKLKFLISHASHGIV